MFKKGDRSPTVRDLLSGSSNRLSAIGSSLFVRVHSGFAVSENEKSVGKEEKADGYIYCSFLLS